MASSSPSSFPSPSPSPDRRTPIGPLFTKFPELPPEIRHQIWRAALPEPGINFFNVHCIPNDHNGANRSTSPPWLYLDLRRLSIHDDDVTVESYDPSAWLARDILCRVCHEARATCALSPSEGCVIVLTRPKRGLFVRAADGQIRSLTPVTSYGAAPVMLGGPGTEPLERRKIRVRSNDVLCLSLENCSFNLPYEETPMIDGGGRNAGYDQDYLGLDDGLDADDIGWAYDPQLTPPLPGAIPSSRLCIGMARASRVALGAAGEVARDLLTYGQSTWGLQDDSLLRVPQVMFEACKQELGDRSVDELGPHGAKGGVEVLWDRFGDRYVKVPWDGAEGLFSAEYRIAKVWPESNDIRERYLQSAMLQSPKRLVSRPR